MNKDIYALFIAVLLVVTFMVDTILDLGVYDFTIVKPISEKYYGGKRQ